VLRDLPLSAVARGDRPGAAELDLLDAELHRLVETQERHLDDCLVLYAGTNEPNPRLSRLLGSPIGSRPNLGPPGDTYNRGMDDAARLSVLVDALLCRLFDVPYAEARVPSGSIANLYAYLAITRPGDRIMALSDAAAGHVTHHAAGAAGLAHLEVHEIPFDADRMDVDLEGAAAVAASIRPTLVIVAGSMCLFPYDVRGLRRIADDVGATLLYDAAHMGGLIAGRRFQAPLREGAHLMTGSTYKSFGGPPAGMVLTTEAHLAERLDRIAFPGLTANSDLARQAALGLALLDLLTFGEPYADACIDNAVALADALTDRGVAVFRPAGRGGAATASQHVAVDARPYGGGDAAAKRLEAGNLLCSSIGLPVDGWPVGDAGLRFGTQELTRRGMGPDAMERVATLVAAVLVDGADMTSVRREVAALRRSFPTLHFVRHGTGAAPAG
jgi:glycine hydroxymethyltransferase